MGVIRPLIFLCAGALAAGLAGCAALEVHNDPVNRPLGGNAAAALAAAGRDNTAGSDDLMVGLAFSGGGTRAAAFSFGVLSEIERTRVPGSAGAGSLLERVNFVSGVSGGSVLTAYYGLKKRAALADFRERFLLRNAEESISTNLSPLSVVRAVAGGVNDPSKLARWLDANLFEGATFADMRRTRGPGVWINAADIYNRTTFVFGSAAFAALCSDLASYPIADAVAASAAVPVVFAPAVIKSYPQNCTDKPPEWIKRAQSNPNTVPMLKAFANALARYHSGSMNYVKLLDGGLVDNFGLSGFTIARLLSDTPYGPLTRQEAVRLRRAIIIIVDAGRGPSGNWTQTVEGPGGTELMMAAADTAIDASVRASFTAFKSVMDDWQGALIRWRCGLSADERAKLGAAPDWNCRDLRFYINRVGFDQLGPERAAALNAVATRFTLPPEEVDALITAGGDALRQNTLFREFLTGVGQGPRQVPSARVRDAVVAAVP